MSENSTLLDLIYLEISLAGGSEHLLYLITNIEAPGYFKTEERAYYAEQENRRTRRLRYKEYRESIGGAKCNFWKPEEDNFIKEHLSWKASRLAKHLGRSLRAIYCRRRSLTGKITK